MDESCEAATQQLMCCLPSTMQVFDRIITGYAYR